MMHMLRELSMERRNTLGLVAWAELEIEERISITCERAKSRHGTVKEVW
jgi:hypothetical protein